jgi:hypothetical protein
MLRFLCGSNLVLCRTLFHRCFPTRPPFALTRNLIKPAQTSWNASGDRSVIVQVSVTVYKAGLVGWDFQKLSGNFDSA